jgi:predicted ArsR family transcriptional regulator
MKSVRQRVLEFIHSHGAVTAGELSQAFRMSKANARHHLDELTIQGLIQVIGYRRTPGRGRPARVFSPSERILGDNLDMLAAVSLEELAAVEENDSDPIERLAGRMAQIMGFDEAISDVAGRPTTNMTRQLQRLTQILNEFHYQSHWEARPDAPRLILGHCPYAAIIDKHPELCKLDAHLLENLLSTPVVQLAKLERDSTGLKHCVFRIGKEQV